VSAELKIRAQKLLDELESWFISEGISPPHYVQHQIDQLRRTLEALA